MLYTAPFDIVEENSLYGFGTLTVSNGASAGADVVIALSSVRFFSRDGTEASATTFWVWDDAARLYCEDQSPYARERFGSFSEYSWAAAVDQVIKAEALVQGWDLDIPTLTFSTSTGAYGFSASLSNTSLTFSTTNGAKLFGFSGNSSSAASHTSDITPLYVIAPTQLQVSFPSPSYEPDAIGGHIVTDTGQSHGLSAYDSELYRDWVQQFETLAKTERDEAASSHPWTFLHLFEHCRTKLPFVVSDGGFATTSTDPEVFMFREDGASFVPERATPGNPDQLHIGFRCSVQGYLRSSAAYELGDLVGLLGTRLVYLYRALDANVTEAGGLVETWVDEGPNGWDMTQATSGLRPAWVEDGDKRWFDVQNTNTVLGPSTAPALAAGSDLTRWELSSLFASGLTRVGGIITTDSSADITAINRREGSKYHPYRVANASTQESVSITTPALTNGNGGWRVKKLRESGSSAATWYLDGVAATQNFSTSTAAGGIDSIQAYPGGGASDGGIVHSLCVSAATAVERNLIDNLMSAAKVELLG